MKSILLCILFLPAVIFSLRQKKWYLYLMVGLTAVLPEQFSLRIHDSLPLLTASRMLIILAAVFWLIERINSRKFSIPISLAVALGIQFLLSLIHLPNNTSELNSIFLLVAERGLVVVMLVDLVANKEEMEKCVDVLILSCCALAVVGICQTVLGFDIAEVLHLVETPTSASLKPRMQLTRAFGTTNALVFGNYCSMMALLIYYRMEQTGLKRYSVAFALDIVALLATLSRSSWLCFLGTGVLLLISRPKRALRTLVPGIVLSIVLCVCLSWINPRFGWAIVENGKSCANVVLSKCGAEINASSKLGTELSVSDEFGSNQANASYSREFQWTALKHMAEEGTLFLGNGYRALLRGMVHFVVRGWGNEPVSVSFIDVGAVALIVEYGIAGLMTRLSLLGYMLVQSVRKRSRTDEFDFFRMMALVIIMYCMLNILSSYVNPQLIWLIFGLFYTYDNLNRKIIEA